MRTRIQKWGNSLAVRIPKAFAAEARLQQDTVVEVSLVDGKLLIVPVIELVETLDQLLAGVTKENPHDTVDWAPAVGNEM